MLHVYSLYCEHHSSDLCTCVHGVGVALLPFVDEQWLLKALEIVYPDLEDDESKFYVVYF